MAGRGEAGAGDLVGMFVNTVVLRTRVEPGMRFGEVLDAVREAAIWRRSRTRMCRSSGWSTPLAPARSTAHHPLFQVACDVQRGDAGVPGCRGWPVEPLDLDPGIVEVRSAGECWRSDTRRTDRRPG